MQQKQNQLDTIDEFVIDPITMRKIPKRPSHSPLQQTPNNNEAGAPTPSFNIPVKPYTGPEKASNAAKSTIHTHPTIQKLEKEGQNWLSQEGFGVAPRSAKASAPSSAHKISKIESALERHLDRGKGHVRAEAVKPSRAALVYDPVESKAEDVDLLSASDIRASAGRLSKTAKETPKEKEERREALERKYSISPNNLDKRLEAEISARREQSEKEMVEELESIAKDVRKRDALSKTHEEEVKAQKAAMEAHEVRGIDTKSSQSRSLGPGIHPGEGDMALNVHEFGGRDRWYKRKAPHASTQSEQKLLQASKDTAFVREIQDIYEDTYGVIDAQHRQQTTTQPAETSDYPGDACPGTLYDQPWSANVLNDHPEIDSHGSVTATQVPDPQLNREQPTFQVLTLIGKLFDELRENQAFLQG